MNDPKCPFCQRITNGEYERGESPHIVFFEPLNPVTPGHMLFVPVGHVTDAVADPIAAAEAMVAAADFAATYQVGPCNLITSIGREATQSVFHLHVHLVPRRKGDGLHLPWTGQQR